MSATAPVSVLVPTVGRDELLQGCLRSLAACRPRAREVVVLDQSGGDAIPQIVAGFAAVGARTIALPVRNKALALNVGLREAAYEVVLVIDDDCTAAEEWIGAAWSRVSTDPSAIVTGRVLTTGEPLAVPSSIDDEAARDYTGEVHYGALFGGNMACRREPVLALGGFDARVPDAEDNDLCYRWLRAGQRLRYEPELVVWHHGWRTPEELAQHYFVYGRGQGLFYAKHLRQGDLGVVRFLARDLYRGARGIAARIVRGRGEWPDARSGLLSGVLVGLVRGWRRFGAAHGLSAGAGRALRGPT